MAAYDIQEPAVQLGASPIAKGIVSIATGGASTAIHGPIADTIIGARGMIRERLENYIAESDGRSPAKHDPVHQEKTRVGIVDLLRGVDPDLHKAKNPRKPETMEEKARVMLYEALGGHQKPKKEIESTKEIKPLLGPSGAKEQPVCLDATTGERVQLYGSQAGSLAVRGLADIANVVIKSVSAVCKVGRIMRTMEHTMDF